MFRKRYSGRKDGELNEDDCDLSIALLSNQQKQKLKRLSDKLFGGSARPRLSKSYLKVFVWWLYFSVLYPTEVITPCC